MLQELHHEHTRIGEQHGNETCMNHGTPISNNTHLFAIYRMGYHSRMTGHGFRGVVSTTLHEQGYENEQR
jgi:hypothetical protein